MQKKFNPEDLIPGDLYEIHYSLHNSLISRKYGIIVALFLCKVEYEFEDNKEFTLEFLVREVVQSIDGVTYYVKDQISLSSEQIRIAFPLHNIDEGYVSEDDLERLQILRTQLQYQ